MRFARLTLLALGLASALALGAVAPACSADSANDAAPAAASGVPDASHGGDDIDTGATLPVDAAAGDTSTADAAPPVAPFACPAGSPEAVFVAETPPPATVAPWSRPFASVVFANCGTTTWTVAAPNAASGVKLGPSAPHDAETWTPSRIALPADVRPGNAVTIVVPIHVGPLTGAHAYAFELVREAVAWLGQPSPTHSIDVETEAAAKVALCAGVLGDPTGNDDTRLAIQTCIDATPAAGTLALPAGIYRLSGAVAITKPMTVTTAGASGNAASCLSYDAPRCAVLRADATLLPSASGNRGFVRMGLASAAVSSVTLDHVVVDGNRAARLGSPAASACASGNNGEGINIGASCTNCSFVGSASARALCGSGLEWDGDGVTVKNSVFLGNGDHGTQNMWSDGLTIHKSDGAVVDACRFIDNTDVGSSRAAERMHTTRATWPCSSSKRRSPP